MILTGKAKLDFENWIYEKGVTGQIDLSNFEFDKFEFLSKTSQYAIITDWLDSVGIYIEIGVYPQSDNRILFSLTIYGYKSYEEWRSFQTRNQATEAVIKLANDLYNGNK